MKNDDSLEYFTDIADRCSTVSGIQIYPGGEAVANYDPVNTDSHLPSAAMSAKAALAATNLGVDVVIIIGTDTDSCQ